jgi:ABC-type antimicrobial peptide transport system permease subunit
VLSYSVAERKQEFGIRLALGARHVDLLRMVLRQALLLASSGIVIGLCTSLLLTRLLESTLYDTGSREPGPFVLASVVFLAVAMLASYLPAKRAMNVNPVDTLR